MVEMILAVIVLACVAVLARTFRVVPQARAGVIQRLGSYQRAANSGLVVVLPFIDTMLPPVAMALATIGSDAAYPRRAEADAG